MMYQITTYRNQERLGSIIAEGQTLTDAEREATLIAKIRGEKIEDVFYPVGESKVVSTQVVGGVVVKFTRTVKPTTA